MPSKQHEWVVCTGNSGRLHNNGDIEHRTTSFKRNSVGYVLRRESDGTVVVCLVRGSETWSVPETSVEPLDVTETGDKFEHKICNICHRLLPTEKMFQKNQTNLHGIIRRPSCRQCRTNIDKRAPKSAQAKRMEKKRPADGSFFRCPICRKRSIVSVTAEIVADHNHHTGDIRGFICDSCNTGLGRFQDDPNLLRNAILYLEERDPLHA